MNKLQISITFTFLLCMAALPVCAQNQTPTSAWVRATVSGERQPRGYVQYQNYCSACHGEGAGSPGTDALEAKYKGAEPALLAKRTDLTSQLVKLYVRHGISIMPFFRKTEISDSDLDAIAAYLTRDSKR